MKNKKVKKLNKKIVALIPARGGSKGVKLKNLHVLGKKPLLDWTIRASKKEKILNRIFVSTDHKKIKQYALSCGVEVHDRPKKYASDSATTYDTVKNFYHYLINNKKYKPDILVGFRLIYFLKNGVTLMFFSKTANGDALIALNSRPYFIS